MHLTPLADEYTLGYRAIDPVMRPICGLLALPHVGLDILLIGYLRCVIHLYIPHQWYNLANIILSHL
jgi:hypothetical protein